MKKNNNDYNFIRAHLLVDVLLLVAKFYYSIIIVLHITVYGFPCRVDSKAHYRRKLIFRQLIVDGETELFIRGYKRSHWCAILKKYI